MTKRKYILEFPKGSGDYWYLYWIGEIIYDKSLKVKLYFVNKDKPMDDLKDFNLKEKYTQVISIAYLCEFKIGTIYSVSSQEIINYKLSKSRFISKINVSINLKPTSKTFPLINLDNRFYPSINNLISPTFTYMKFNHYGNSILVTPYCLAQYFFFKSSKLLNLIFSGTLLDCFCFSKIRFLEDEEHNQSVIELPFNQSMLSNNNAKLIAPYLFMKNNLGLKMIKGLYSNLHTDLSHARINKERPETYPKINLEFNSYELGVEGKPFYSTIENKEKYYFLVYNIKYFRLKESNPFIVDRIDLIPYNSKESTKDRENHDKEEVTRPIQPNTTKLSLMLNNDSARDTKISNEATITDEAYPPFDVKVNIKSREFQNKAYKVISTPFNGDLEGVVREANNLYENLNFLQEEIKKEFEYFYSMDVFEYFRKVTDTLEKTPNITINRDPLNKNRKNHPIKFEVRNHSLYIDIIEIIFQKRIYSYAIEFGKGFIGIFEKKGGQQIDHNTLNGLIKKFIERDIDLESNKVLWSSIARQHDYFEKYFSIIIRMGVEHTRKEEAEIENIKSTAHRVYDRIVNNIL